MEVELVSKSTIILPFVTYINKISQIMNINFSKKIEIDEISPQLTMIIGSLLIAYGLYRYLNNKEVNC